MGIHGNATCVMTYEDATGWLVGEENQGLPAMFIMMNEARLGVGVQGLALAEAAYQAAVRSPRTGCRAAPPVRRNTPTDRPTRSSCTRTCGGC